MTSVFVMPLRTWLAGDFRATWRGESTSRPCRSDAEHAAELRDSLLAALEPLIGRRPAWDEDAPARAALALGAHSFSLPFLLARRWSYRLKLPTLCALEGFQLWIPEPFEEALRVPSPWSDETVMVASLQRLTAELARLREHMEAEESPEVPEVRDGYQVAGRLLDAANEAAATGLPVIVED